MYPLYLPRESSIYVLRIINGNPRTLVDHVRRLLDRVIFLGHQIFAGMGYKVVPTHEDFSQQSVLQHLKNRLSTHFAHIEYSALVYGSCATENCMLSDVDMMIIVPDDFCSPENVNAVSTIFVGAMMDDGVRLDQEIPYERKLVVSMQFVKKSIEMVGRLIGDGKVPNLAIMPSAFAARLTPFKLADQWLSQPVFHLRIP
jgi:hypothetical protein